MLGFHPLAAAPLSSLFGTHYALSLDAGVITLTGATGATVKSYALVLNAGSISLAGSNLISDRSVKLDSTLLSLAGSNLISSRSVKLDSTLLSLAGSNLISDRSVKLDSNALSLAGSNLISSRSVKLDSNALSLAGATGATVKSYALVLNAGSISLAGSNFDVFQIRVIDSQPHNFVLTGQNTNLIKTNFVNAEVGKYNYNLYNQTKLKDYKLYTLFGSNTLTVYPTTLNLTAKVELNHFSYSLYDVSAIVSRNINLNSGTIAATISNAKTLSTKLIKLESDSYSLFANSVYNTKDTLIKLESDIIEILPETASLTKQYNLNQNSFNLNYSGADSYYLNNKLIIADKSELNLSWFEGIIGLSNGLPNIALGFTGANADTTQQRIIQSDNISILLSGNNINTHIDIDVKLESVSISTTFYNISSIVDRQASLDASNIEIAGNISAIKIDSILDSANISLTILNSISVASRQVSLDASNIEINAFDTNDIRNIVSDNSAGDILISGLNTENYIDYYINSNNQIIQLDGKSISFYRDIILATESGYVDLLYNDTNLIRNYISELSPEIYNLSSNDSNLKYEQSLILESGIIDFGVSNTSNDLAIELHSDSLYNTFSDLNGLRSNALDLFSDNIDLTIFDINCSRDLIFKNESGSHIISATESELLHYKDIQLDSGILIYQPEPSALIKLNTTNAESGEYNLASQPTSLYFDRTGQLTQFAINLITDYISDLSVDFTRGGSFTLTGFDAELVANLQVYSINPDYIVFHNVRNKNIKYQFIINR